MDTLSEVVTTPSDAVVTAYPQLDNPPIVEVVCGVKFSPQNELDPLLLGAYWHLTREKFPKRQLREALQEGIALTFGGIPPARAFLVSQDEQFVLQAQSDRFYVNWRKIPGSAYPRFSGRHGDKGLLSRTLEYYDQFAEFVQHNTGTRLEPNGIELAKVDRVGEAEMAQTGRTLSQVVPVYATLRNLGTDSDQAQVNFQVVEPAADGTTIVSVSTLPNSAPVTLQMEARHVSRVEPNAQLTQAFEKANQVVNGVFFRLIPNAKQVFS